MADEDKPKLKPANGNAWYCLATLYGEHTGAISDRELTNRNRLAWLRWLNERVPEADFVDAFRSRMGCETAALSRIGDKIDFSFLCFDQSVDFSGFLFAWDTTFEGSTFSFPSDFSSATFSGYANFNSVKFSTYVLFCSATFMSLANFGSATFAATGNFASAKFSSSAYFRNATFSGDGSFRSTEFLGPAEFGPATFVDSVYFDSAHFSDYADFSSVIFLDSANFMTSEFHSRTNFARSIFILRVPDFRGASLHEATEFDDTQWPAPPSDFRWPFAATRKDLARQQVYAYQRLKQEMEKLKKHEDELIFFRKELRAKRGTFPTLSASWCLNWLYDVASGYGQSVGRPFLWLLAIFAVAMIYFTHANVVEGLPLPPPDAASLSFVNMFSFLSLRRDFFGETIISQFSRETMIVSAVESVLAVVFLFLLGLGLRNRFRIK